MLRQRLACSRHQFYVRWISAVHVATRQLTPLWPSHRLALPETLAITLSKNTRCLEYQSRLTSRPLDAARPPTKKLRKRRKSIGVWINSGTRVKKTLAPPQPSALIAGLGKICPRLCAWTVTRKNTTRGTALSPEKICQKTSIGFGDLCSDDLHH